MATAEQVLTFLIPNGGYVLRGDTYEGLSFVECDPISKAEFEAGFAKYDAWKSEQDAIKTAQKTALLNRLGITADEVKLLLS